MKVKRMHANCQKIAQVKTVSFNCPLTELDFNVQSVKIINRYSTKITNRYSTKITNRYSTKNTNRYSTKITNRIQNTNRKAAT